MRWSKPRPSVPRFTMYGMAMSSWRDSPEPNDVVAVRDGDEWVINGQKTFITNGIHSDLVIVVARTDPSAGSKGFSLLVVERGMPGFSRGRKLHKVGLAGQDTAELVFEDCLLYTSPSPRD